MPASVPDEIGACPRLGLREFDPGLLTGIYALQYPGDVPAERPHGLQNLSILDHLFHGVAVGQVPVLGAGDDHAADQEVLVQPLEGSGVAASPGVHDAGPDLSAELPGVAVEEAVHPGADLSGRAGVVHGGAEDESVEFLDPVADRVYIIIDDGINGADYLVRKLKKREAEEAMTEQ